MKDFYENDNRTASIEALITNDFSVAFYDAETANTQYETFHTIEKAQDAASRWIVKEYVPL
jgi:hypothetical protein